MSATCAPVLALDLGTAEGQTVSGKSDGDKAAMVAAMQALGFKPADDNEADALALLRWPLAEQMAGELKSTTQGA